MFAHTALSLLVSGLSTTALPTNSSATFTDLPAVGSIVDYSNLDLRPLQDITALNGSFPSSDPASEGAETLRRRQEIDFDLVESTPDPVVAPGDYTNYNQQAAIDAVVADISQDPLPQKRDILVSTGNYNTAPVGFTSISVSSSAAINAPLNCNGADTFMGSKLFNSGPFDESLCAAACTAQNVYNLKHPPASGLPKLCRFYNTYVLLKNDTSQGQYCSLYTQAWDASYATNVGQWRGKFHYTIQQNTAAANSTDTGDVSCPSDVAYLSANGAAFCSAYISYIPSVSTVVTIATPATSFVTSIQTVSVIRVVQSRSVTTSTILTTTTLMAANKRDLQTPASVSTWSPPRLSRACSAVATGSTTTTITQTAATPLSTFITTQRETSTTTTSTTILRLTTSTVTTVVSAPTDTSLGSNLLRNPSFEQGDGYGLSGYGWWGSGIDSAYRSNAQSSAAYGGTYVGVLWNRQAGSNILRQDFFDLSTSDKYTLSFHYQHYQGTSGTCSLITSLGGIVNSAFVIPKVDTAYGWSHYTYVSIPNIPAGSYYQPLVFEFKCTQLGSMYLDNVAFSKQL